MPMNIHSIYISKLVIESRAVKMVNAWRPTEPRDVFFFPQKIFIAVEWKGLVYLTCLAKEHTSVRSLKSIIRESLSPTDNITNYHKEKCGLKPHISYCSLGLESTRSQQTNKNRNNSFWGDSGEESIFLPLWLSEATNVRILQPQSQEQ